MTRATEDADSRHMELSWKCQLLQSVNTSAAYVPCCMRRGTRCVTFVVQTPDNICEANTGLPCCCLRLCRHAAGAAALMPLLLTACYTSIAYAVTYLFNQGTGVTYNQGTGFI
jgi:hypothetical protein